MLQAVKIKLNKGDSRALAGHIVFGFKAVMRSWSEQSRARLTGSFLDFLENSFTPTGAGGGWAFR